MAAKKIEPPRKPAPTPPPAKSMLPAKVDNEPQLPATAYDYGKRAGDGFEDTTSEDYAIPFLNLLQNGSPEVGAEGPDRKLEGAEPGMLINSVSKELFTEVFFVPVTRRHVFIEWRPRSAGGGLVGRHETSSEVVRAAKAKPGKDGELLTEEGNELVETFELVGYILNDVQDTEPGQVVMISFTSTKIKPYRMMMQNLKSHLVTMGDGRRLVPPLYAHRLKLSSVPQQNSKGRFFNFDIKAALGNTARSMIPNDSPLIDFGETLKISVESGERQPDDDSVNNHGNDDGGEDNGPATGAKPPF